MKSPENYERPNTGIIHLFERHAIKSTNKVAIIIEDQKITYSELASITNHIFETLGKFGVGKGDLIGICMKRGPHLIAAILAVLKTGAGYVPLDANFPRERMKYIVKDSAIRFTLTSSGVSWCEEHCPSILVEFQNYDNMPSVPPYVTTRTSDDDIAYVIYTSGTTGKPKGVIITHGSLINFFYGITDILQFNENEKRVLCSTTHSFDIFVLEMFLPLLNGHTIILANESECSNPKLLYELIKKSNFIQMTPSRMQLLIAAVPNLSFLNVETIILGGEQLRYELLDELRSFTNSKIYNAYGPTEATVWTTIADVTDSKTVHIGQPIPNMKVIVLDEKGCLIKEGSIGELCISGTGLARGYLNNELLTQERFIYSVSHNKERIYKTGDLVRLTRSGTIEFIGRIDEQIKVQGHRVEIKEIESSLLSIPSIEQVVVTYDETYEILIAFVMVGPNYSEHETYAKIGDSLPPYMIPERLVEVEEIPLNTNGKVDKYKLKELFRSGNCIVKQLSEIKALIERTLMTILGVEAIGENDDLYSLGGTSLQAIRMSSLLKSYGLQIEPSKVLQSNVGELYKLAESLDQNISIIPEVSSELISEIKTYPTTYFQSKYIREQEQNSRTITGMYVYPVSIQGLLDTQKFERALNRVVRTNPILSSIIVKGDNENYLHSYRESSLDLNITKTQKQNENLIKCFIKEEMSNPINIFKEIPIRFRLIECLEEDSVLLMVINHIAFDDKSIRLIIEKILIEYERDSLHCAVDSSFPYYAFYEEESIKHNRREMEFWENQVIKSSSAEAWKEGPYWERDWIINNDLKSEILVHCKKMKVTKGVFFLAIYQKLLHRLFDKENITVGLTMSTRNQEMYQSAIGPFVNHGIFTADKVLASLDLSEICKVFNEVFSNYIGNLFVPLEYFRKSRDKQGMFDFLLNYFDSSNQDVWESNGIKFVKYRLSQERSNRSMLRRITLNVFETEDTFRINFRAKSSCLNEFMDVEGLLEEVLRTNLRY